MHAQLAEDVLGVRQHVHQMADRRTLISADIADTGFQECLGDRENTLAAEGLARAQAQFLDLFGKRALCHCGASPASGLQG